MTIDKQSVTVTARSLADYQSMFALSNDDLMAGPILDCPGGASSFGADVRSRGGLVISVDPVYGTSTAHIAEHVQRNLQDAAKIFAASTMPIDWGYLGSTQAYVRASLAAADRFHSDFARNHGSYVAAALPDLPFADCVFRLALTSHLLFVYDTQFSYADHLTALTELVRVSPAEVRVHPIVDSHGRLYHRLDELRDGLSRRGILTDIRPVTGTWITDAAQMLICWKTGWRPARD